MIVKIWLENTQDLRWVAILLDKEPPTVPLRSQIGDSTTGPRPTEKAS